MFALCAALGATFVASSLTERPAEAAFPGRNGRIAFHAGQDPASSGTGVAVVDHDIFTVLPGGEGLQQLTQGPANDFAPAWSPDGSQITFTRATTNFGPRDVYIMNADGTELENITETPTEDELGPAWSPDGRRIVFAKATSPVSIDIYIEQPDYNLYIYDLNGGELLQFTNAPGWELAPAWSPDGTWIAFVDDSSRSLMLISADGSRKRALTMPNAFNGQDLRQPDWSPDGTKLAFSTHTSEDCGCSSDIWVVNADATGLRNLTGPEDVESYSPAWSADGKWLAFTRNRGGDSTLYKMWPDGSHMVKLITLDLLAGGSDWGPRP